MYQTQKAHKYLRKSYKAHENRSHAWDFRKFQARKYFQRFERFERISLPSLLTVGWKLSFSQQQDWEKSAVEIPVRAEIVNKQDGEDQKSV